MKVPAIRTFHTVQEVVEFIESFDGCGMIATDSDLVREEVKQRFDFEDLPDGEEETQL